MVLATLDDLQAGYMYQNCAQSAVQNESKTGKFQQSGHACLRKTTSSGAANVAAC